MQFSISVLNQSDLINPQAPYSFFVKQLGVSLIFIENSWGLCFCNLLY